MKYVLYVAMGLIVLGVLGFFTIAPRMVDRQYNRFDRPPPYEVSADARSFYDSLFVADLHDDLLLWSRDPVKRYDYGHTDLPRLLEGNVGLQIFSAVTKSPWSQNYDRNPSEGDRITPLVIAQLWPPRTWTSLKERALYMAERLHGAAERAGGQLIVIRTAADLDRFLEQRAQDPNLVAGILAIEGLHPLEGQLENVDVLYEAGYRMMGLTHFFDNEVAGSAHGMEKGGLTPLGRQVIQRMEDRGIVVDLAHVAPQAIDEVLDMATRPVVVSHTGVQGTCSGPRNLTDEHIRRIAETGGVIGIGYWDGAVCDVTPEAIVRAIRYVADRVGVAHVGLGSDFDGSVRTQFDTTGLALITEALFADGFTRDEIRLIMGGNVVRVLRETI